MRVQLTVLTTNRITGEVTTEDYVLEVGDDTQGLTEKEICDIVEQELGI